MEEKYIDKIKEFSYGKNIYSSYNGLPVKRK